MGLLALSGAVLAIAVVAHTRGRGAGEGAIRDRLATDAGAVHVHGLGVNPADGALFIATHTGMYRVPAGTQEAERIGDSRQDTMGFTVVGPNRFLGSGHPDPEAMREQDLPPNLGLIESTDGGRTWRTLSLPGEADFHILRLRGRFVYGFDSTKSRLLVSDDRGRTWSQRRRGLLFDLAVHPQRPSQLVAATEPGLAMSEDGGRTWRRLGDRLGLLAWPAATRLLLVDGAGRIHVSRDFGKRWAAIGDVGGQPAALVAESPQELYVALHNGPVKRSVDGGKSWEVRARL